MDLSEFMSQMAEGLPVCSDGTRNHCSPNGNFDNFADVLGAAAATAVLLEPELGLELTGNHEACSPGLTDIRLLNPFAQASVHGKLFERL